MKKIITFLVFSSIAMHLIAQDGKNVIQAGVGLSQELAPVYHAYWSPSPILPALNLTYERLLPIKAGPGFLGAGITGSYRALMEDMSLYDADGRRLSRFIRYKTGGLALRTAYHLHPSILKTKKLDLYGAIHVGMWFSRSRYDGADADSDLLYGAKVSRFYVGGVAGARYYFFRGLGAYAELGYDATWLKAGIAARF